MKYAAKLSQRDRALVDLRLRDFLPPEIYDIHAHPYNSTHFPAETWKFLEHQTILGCDEHRSALLRYMPVQTIHGLYFGLPHKRADRPSENAWVATDVKNRGTPLSRALMLVSPDDAPSEVAAELKSGRFCGLKVYHCYAPRPDTMSATLSEFAPEWMWELLNETRGLLMLHLVRDEAIADASNQSELRRLCRAYPKVRLILAHIGRSFNYRNATGLKVLADLDNAVVDTSAICETEAFRTALEILGPRRILFGSDFPISEARGRCITIGNSFFWLHPENLNSSQPAAISADMTLVGIESLMCLREACNDAGLNRQDIEDIFLRNALRTLKPFLPEPAAPEETDGPALWQHARNIISGGTGLLSKRAEMFETKTWPAYFSRCSGCEVWDLAGNRYVDWVGGIGAVLLGYADPDVTAAVKRRLALGTYCSLVNPQEVELAEKLLALHPWAGKVRYARGGGEAMAIAVRIARAATGRSGIAFCGYHGWHDWYLAANLSRGDALDGHLLPGLDPRGVPPELSGTAVPFRYNDLASLDAALTQLDGKLAAVVMEPMRSQLPVDDFVGKAAARCRAAGAVFVVDEVTSGLRFGFPGALSRLGVQPDLVVYAKAMSNGFPFAAIIGGADIMSAAEASFISSSYWTDGIGPAAALAVLEKVHRLKVHELVWNRGLEFQKRLNQLADAYPACRLMVGGMPAAPTLVFELGSDAALAKTLYIRKMRERGFLVSTVFFLMLAHESPHFEQLLENLDEVLAEIETIIASGQLGGEASAFNAQPGFARLA